MDAEFLALMPHTITHAAVTGTDDWGKPTYGTPTSYACYIEPAPGELIVRNAEGKERQAKYKIYVNATAILDPDGQLTLPAGYTPQTPPFWSCSLVYDESGAHHVEITV